MLTTGNQGRNSPCNRHDPEWKLTVLFGDIFQFAIGQRRFFMNAGGHDLNLSFGHIDDFVAGSQFNQSVYFLGRQLFWMNDQINLEVVGFKKRVFATPLQRADAGYFARYAKTVGNQTGHHIDGIVIGDRNQIIHLSGFDLSPAFNAHGIALNHAGI